MSLNQQLSSYQNLLLQQTKAEDPVQAIKDAAVVFVKSFNDHDFARAAALYGEKGKYGFI